MQLSFPSPTGYYYYDITFYKIGEKPCSILID